MSTRAFRLRAPAYANELRAMRALGLNVNLHAHIGTHAWGRANHSGHRPRMVIDLSDDKSPDDFDFSCCDGLELVLNASDCELSLARATAVRMCEHGAALVVLLHPALAKCSEFFYGARP